MSNLIDAQLRIVILDSQLKEVNRSIIDELLFQEDSNKKITEKQIYHRVLDRGVIDNGTCKKLYDLYDTILVVDFDPRPKGRGYSYPPAFVGVRAWKENGSPPKENRW